MGRPRKEIDGQLVKDMSMIGCTIAMMADHFGCNRITLERRFRKEINEGKANGQVRALGEVYRRAMAGQVRCLELYLINMCGWSTKPDVQLNVVQNSLYGVGHTDGLPAVQMVSQTELLKMAQIAAEVAGQAPGLRVSGQSSSGNGELGNGNGQN